MSLDFVSLENLLDSIELDQCLRRSVHYDSFYGAGSSRATSRPRSGQTLTLFPYRKRIRS